jgi:hypothetical protein
MKLKKLEARAQRACRASEKTIFYVGNAFLYGIDDFKP